MADMEKEFSVDEKDLDLYDALEDAIEEEGDDDVVSTSLLDVVVNSREDAEKIVGSFYITAISYRGEVEDTEEIKSLRIKVNEMKDRIKKFAEENSVKTFASKTIGCKKCGSSLAKDYLKSDVCPLCGNDLRSTTTIERENVLKQKAELMEQQLEDMVRANRILNGKIETLSVFE